MGVLACDRQGCENIMCDHYSHEHGYICYECLEELSHTNGRMTITDFMNTSKTSTAGSLDWHGYVMSEFRNLHDD